MFTLLHMGVHRRPARESLPRMAAPGEQRPALLLPPTGPRLHPALPCSPAEGSRASCPLLALVFLIYIDVRRAAPAALTPCHPGFIPHEGALKVGSGGAPWEVAEDALCTWSDGFVLTFKRSWSCTEAASPLIPCWHEALPGKRGWSGKSTSTF